MMCPDCGMLVSGGVDEVNVHKYERKCEFTPDGDFRLLKELALGADRPHPTVVFARVLLRIFETPYFTALRNTNAQPLDKALDRAPDEGKPPFEFQSEDAIAVFGGVKYIHPSQNPVDR